MNINTKNSMNDREQILNAVRERYAAVASTRTVCSNDHSRTAESSCCSADLYEVDLSTLPTDVTGLSLSCGDPIALAALEPGQRVLDLGSGGGIDCFLAAQRVGPAGHVIGVDMTAEMIARAEANRRRIGADNVEFRLGQIEALPVADASIDVTISNCVVNLSPDKSAVLREVFRVLVPGGHLAISDMVTYGNWSVAQRADLQAWSECIAGAEEAATLAHLLAEVGFVAVSIRDRGNPDVELATAQIPLGPPRLFSAHITAHKPAAIGRR